MKKTGLVIIAILIIQFVNGQQNDTINVGDTVKKSENSRRDSRPLKERISFGLGGSFWINSSQTYVEIAPAIAYSFPKRLVTGVGYRYIWRHEKNADVDLNAWGPNVFAKLDLVKKIYFWTEYEVLTNQYLTSLDLMKEKTTTDAWFAGLGYNRSVGRKGRGGISIMVLYNFLYKDDIYNPYYSPVIYRIGYFF